MSAVDAGSQNRRLQFLLLLLIVWDALALAAELSFGGPLFEPSDGAIGGLLAGGRAAPSAAPLSCRWSPTFTVSRAGRCVTAACSGWASSSRGQRRCSPSTTPPWATRSEEHTSELQS